MIPFFQVDAFTSTPFHGNPAGVCILDEEVSASWMQSVAYETNFSETAFVYYVSGNFSIRYFTPTTEVPLCGHATLSAAHILWQRGLVAKGDTITFESKSGFLKARLEGGWIELTFPKDPLEQISIYPHIKQLFGCTPLQMFHTKFCGYYLLVLDSEYKVQSLSPNFHDMVREGIGEVVVTAASNSSDVDFVLRFFAPSVGINEDPVTGSAFCSLGPYWAKQLGKIEVIGKQISKRGGQVKVRSADSRNVILTGQAITIIQGNLLV